MNAVYKLVHNRMNKLNKEGKALLQLRVYLWKKQRFFSTGIYITPKQWDASNRKIVKHPTMVMLNKQLRDMVSDLEDYEIRVGDEGKTFGFGHIEQYLNGAKDIEWLAFCRKHLEENKKIKYSTYRAVRSKLNVIEEAGIIASFSDLTYENVLKFDYWLRSKDKTTSTILKYHSVLKMYITHAIRLDLFTAQNNPYLKFKPERPKPGKRKYLDIDEVRSIEEKEFSMKRLNQVKDVFLFSIYTGLAYADICDLKKADIYTDPEKYKWIWRDRMKTESEYKVPLLPQAAAILERYHEETALLPVKSNQKMNAYLKEIATLCEIDKELTFHMARHTFATTITLSNDVPIDTVSKMMGHSSLKTTQIYAKIVDSKMKSDMQNLREKLDGAKKS